MYLAAAGLGAMKWHGEDLEKMKSFVDKENASKTTYHKYCLLELDNSGWGLYQRNKNLYGCHPTVAYDPCNVAQSVVRYLTPDFNFVRNFGGKSRD